ncbi:MAG: TonB-dependent receptor, partial [Bryobacteraceae bacterium]
DVADVGVSTVFDQKKLADLPIGQGNATLLFMFAPAASSAGGLDASPTERQTGWTTNFNGSPRGSAEYTIDGAPNTQLGNTGLGGGPASLPNNEVVQEVRIQTNNFDASLGHTGGVTIDLSLKSGTNDLHGTAFGFMRQPDWNANSWASNRAGRARPDFDFRRLGFAGGGPVVIPKLYNGKNRTFFHYGYERYQALFASIPTNATVPTAEQRNGNFSGLLRLGPQYQLYDPDTGVLNAGRIQRTPYPGNIIPPSRFDPNAQKMISYWPLPNQPGTADGQFNYNYILSPLPRTYWSSVLRMDHELTRAHKMSGKFMWADLRQPYFTTFGNPDPSLAAKFRGLNRDVGLSDLWTIRPNFIAEFRASLLRGHFNESPAGVGVPYANVGLESAARVIDTERAGLPYVVAAGYRASDTQALDGPVHQYPGRHVVSEVRNFEGNFTRILSNHSVKFGANYRGYIFNTGYADTVYGANFSGEYSRGPFNNSPAPPLGSSLADMLLGRFAFSYVDQRPLASNYSSYLGLYLNDDWKVSPKLTINLGLRYEREGPPTERFNRAVNDFDRAVENPIAPQAKQAYALAPIDEISASQFRVLGGAIFAGVNGQPRTMYDARNLNFAPRVGIAYQLGRSTVLRAGYGVFFLPNGQRFFGGEGQVPGFRTLSWTYSTVDGGLTFPGKLSNLHPAGLLPQVGAGDGLKTFLGQGLSLLSAGGTRNRPSAYNQSWQFEIQQAIKSVYKLQMRYVGNRTLKMPVIRDLNALPNQYLSTSPERDQPRIDRL